MGGYLAYAEYKESGMEWLGEIPSHWEVWKATHGFKRIGSGTTPKSDNLLYYDGETPWVTTSELRETVITDTSQKVTKEALEEYSALRLYQKGSLAIAMYGATIGRLGILGIDAAVNQACCVFAEPSIFDTKFFYYWLWMRRPILISLSTGGGQPNLSQDDLRQLRIPIPPISEQRSIARFLDYKTAQIDILITKKETLLKKLAEKRTALISQAVTKGCDRAVPMKDSGIEWLGEIPAHWQVMVLKRLAQVHGGVAKGRKLNELETLELPYLRVANVQDGHIDTTEISTIEITIDELQRYSLQAGDVLMNEGGDNDKLGRGAVWDAQIFPCLHQNHVFAVRPHDRNLSDWLALVTLSSYAKFYFFSKAKQSTNLASISATNIKLLPVVLPPKEERDKIFSYLNVQHAEIDKALDRISEAVNRLKEYRTALITNAVTGKIDVRDVMPEPEPVEAA